MSFLSRTFRIDPQSDALSSGLFEARLGAEEMPGKEVHVFCAGYRADEFEELLQYADHIVFNSPSQLLRFAFFMSAFSSRM